jgi:hypothetical protein
VGRSEAKIDIEIFVDFFGKHFRHGLFAKVFDGVFELTLPRNAQKRTKTKTSENQSRLVVGWVCD